MKTQRTSLAALLALGLVLGGYALTVPRPSLPPDMKADEPAYYLMALSLVRDHDLRCDARDLERLYAGFMVPASNLILMSDDNWNTVYFGKPYLYSLMAAPLVAAFDASGLIVFNVLCLLAMIWMGARYLITHDNPPGIAYLFSTAFFLLSCTSAYVFWMHPELFNMTCIMLSLYLVFGTRDGGSLVKVTLSGAALSLAVYGKPMFVAVALPILVLFFRQRNARALTVWVGGAIAAVTLAATFNGSLTGHPSAYLGVARAGVKVYSPWLPPVMATANPVIQTSAEAVEQPSVPPPNDSPTSLSDRLRKLISGAGSWWWLVRVPDPKTTYFRENLGYFLWGRHTGLFAYMPFVMLCLVLFLLHGWRSGERWALLSALGALAVYFLVFIPFNWHGGGGFIGNRYYVNLYPAFLFLVTRIRPAAIIPPFCFVSSLLVGSLLFTGYGYGGVVPDSTLQAHARNYPLRLLPKELSDVRITIPGYRGVSHSGVWFESRKDLFRPNGDEMWIHGSTSVEVLMLSAAELGVSRFHVRSLVGDNRVELVLGSDRRQVSFAAAGEQMVDLAPAKPTRTRWDNGQQLFIYRLVITTDRGAKPCWLGAVRSDFYIGAAISYLGASADLGRDLYAVEWTCPHGAPIRAAPGEELTIDTCVSNRSSHTWPALGVARVALGYHLRSSDGQPLEHDGARTSLGADVAPGAEAHVALRVLSPSVAGSYLLEIDPVYEHVAWFSERNGGTTLQIPLVVE